MRIRLKSVIAVVAAGAAAGALAVAQTAAADNSEFATNLNTLASKCEKQGNVEINDSLPRANTAPQWSAQGGQSGGPYGGTSGGGPR